MNSTFYDRLFPPTLVGSTLLIALLLCAAAQAAAAAPTADEEKNAFTYLSLQATGVDKFLENHPEWDGRGVVIFVLDNGADVGVAGLLETTTGDPKFIDARDFTGEGDVELAEAVLLNDGAIECPDGEIRLTGLGGLPHKAEDEAYFIGVLAEERLINSEFEDTTGTVDINDNGKDDDVFAVLAYPVASADYWVVYVDTDADGEIDDEEMHRDFSEDLKPLYFQRRLPDRQTRPMTFVVNIYPDDEMVTFHYPDGDHSTHVSGIAAGFGIEGQKGFNGVAPGAQLVSCKIGDGTLSGGATVTESMKDAYEFVREYAEDHDDEVVIVNMSYGIGSEVEGSSDIDVYIDNLLLENPNIILCTSAGNEGPGLSTIGTPAASFMAVSVGAVMAQDVGRDAYSVELAGHRLLHFSSRGGELDKPEITAPGACLSTVPRWSENSRFWGTSMASPYMAGVMALLVSAAKQEYPDADVHIGLLRKAVMNSADSLEGGYADLDQGRGFVNVERAWQYLKNYLGEEKDPVLAYDISTRSPVAPGGKSRAAYWRSVYFPRDEAQIFSVAPIFLPDTPAEEINDFFRSFNLESTASFLRPVQESVPIKKDNAAQVRVYFDPEEMKEPGLYSGRIAAYRGDKAPENREFDLLLSAVVPYTFGPENDYMMTVKDVASDPLEPAHYFLAVPPGASRMLIKVSAPEGKFSWNRVMLFDTRGRAHAYMPSLRTDQGATESVEEVAANDLTPGVWELVVWGDFRAGKTSYHDVRVEFMGFDVAGPPPLSLDFRPGSKPRGAFTVTNLFNKSVMASATGTVWGYSRIRDQHVEGDEFSYTFSLDETLSGVNFTIEMSPEDYGLFTDFAINIMDGDGVSLVKDGLSYRKTNVFFPNPGGSGTYTLEMIAGRTHAGGRPFEFKLTEKYLWSQSVPVRVRYVDGSGQIPLVPGIPSRIKYSFAGVPQVAPEGFATSATLNFKERGTEREVLRVRLYTKS